MQLLSGVPKEELRGKRVLVRAGFDVPIVDGTVEGSFRLARSVPTLKLLQEAGAKTIIISHVGRDGESLAPVAAAMQQHIPLTFIPDTVGEEARRAVTAMQAGEVLLLENLRRDEREQANDESFAQEIASLGDVYVDDAFSVAHREHASIVGVPKLLPHYAGLELESEVRELSRALTPAEGSLCIIGGAKFETKEPLIRKFLDIYAHVYICGALANDIFLARGVSVGASKVSDRKPSADVVNHPNLAMPVDVTVIHSDGTTGVCLPNEVQEGDIIADIGPESVESLRDIVNGAPLILWNGPTGIYEKGFTERTGALARMIAEHECISLVGGGDTVTAIEEAGATEKFTFISTGGGAMLEFLQNGTLPGIEALA